MSVTLGHTIIICSLFFLLIVPSHNFDKKLISCFYYTLISTKELSLLQSNDCFFEVKRHGFVLSIFQFVD